MSVKESKLARIAEIMADPDRQSRKRLGAVRGGLEALSPNAPTLKRSESLSSYAAYASWREWALHEARKHEKSADEKSADEESADEESADEKSADEKPTTKKPTTKKQAKIKRKSFRGKKARKGLMVLKSYLDLGKDLPGEPTEDEIRAAYEEASLTYSPDKCAGGDIECSEGREQIQRELLEALGDIFSSSQKSKKKAADKEHADTKIVKSQS